MHLFFYVLQLLWAYIPDISYAFIFLTFVPQLFFNIRAFAVADYEANSRNYHRCYGPDSCCHLRVESMSSAHYFKPRKMKPIYQQQCTKVADAAMSQCNQNVQLHMQATAPSVSPSAELKLLKVRKHFVKDAAPSTHTQSQLLGVHPQETKLGACTITISRLNRVPQAPEADPIPRSTQRSLTHAVTYGGTSVTPPTTSSAASSPLSYSPQDPPKFTLCLRAESKSLEDMFAALARNAEQNAHESFNYIGTKTLSPVTSIDDILSQRRLSRPLSAYSISDLLLEED